MKSIHLFSYLMIISVLLFVACQSGENSKSDINTEKHGEHSTVVDTTNLPHKVIAYYFHGNRRCASCTKIENYTKEAIETGFADELESGQLHWIAINTDKSENEHYVEDYELYTKALVISNIKDGEETDWKNLDKIWQLLNNKEYYIEYVQFEIGEYLERN